MKDKKKAAASSLRHYHRNRDDQLARLKRYHASLSKEQKAEIAKRNRWASLKYRTGFTQEEFQREIERQDNRCKLCNRPFTKADWPVADHSHKCCPGPKQCGKCYRGLIHHKCNAILGLANDDPEIFLAALSYLRG